MGMFAHLVAADDDSEGTKVNDMKSQKSKSSNGSKKTKHVPYNSVDEDLRPIYPPSTATRTTTHNHTQHGSDSTNYTANRLSLDNVPANRQSLEVPPQGRPSVERARPSYDRMRMSMDRVRASYEASNDFTSAARLSRIESSQSGGGGGGRLRARLRGLSLTKSANN
ncbi:hypothetical protein G6O67_002023 [Ophiocordyceps sinensis]|nr:hypothetical protein G6O67_002023 [Ophiocordyceps sinensis]